MTDQGRPPSGGGTSKGLMYVLVGLVVVLVVVAGIGWGLYATKKTSTVPQANTAALTIGDFGVSHPDAGAWAWMYNNTSVFKQYDSNPNVNFEDFPGGSGAVLSAMESGKVQLGMIAGDAAVSAIAKGVNITIVAVYRITPIGDYVLVNPNNTKLNNFSDMGKLANTTGLSFANSAPGSLDYLLDLLLAGQYHWDTSKITHDYVGSFEAQDAAVRDNATNATTGAYFDAWELVKNHQLKVVGDINESWPGFVLVALNSYIKAHPNTLSAALQAIFKVNVLFQQNYTKEYNFIKSYYNMGPNETKFYLSIMKWSTNGTIYLTSLHEEVNAMESAGVLNATEAAHLSFSSLYTSEFYPAINDPFPPT